MPSQFCKKGPTHVRPTAIQISFSVVYLFPKDTFFFVFDIRTKWNAHNLRIAGLNPAENPIAMIVFEAKFI